MLVTREPGGTAISDKIRSIILDPVNEEMVDQAEVLLYAASRAQHVHELILPALKAGRIVLCDRFIDASVAYQSYGLGVDIEMVKSYFEICQLRAAGNKNIHHGRTCRSKLRAIESASRCMVIVHSSWIALSRKMSIITAEYEQAFHQIASDHPERVLVIDANRSVEQIAADIWHGL